MAVLIKGMEMPTSCKDCELAKHFDGYQDNDCPFNAFSYYDCPLIEVPEPHGRLIDADEFCTEHRSLKLLGRVGIRRFNWHVAAAAFVEDAPTIIPASEEG